MEVKTDSMLLFWRNSSRFSNWYDNIQILTPIKDDQGNRLVFRNSEALFMFFKALFFKDAETAQEILRNQLPTKAKQLGRQIKNFDQAAWDQEKEELMYMACMMKFSSDPEMMGYLLDTGDLELVEASPLDPIWGIGLAPDDPAALDKANWKGLNLLGKALMRVRSDLISEADKQIDEIISENQGEENV